MLRFGSQKYHNTRTFSCKKNFKKLLGNIFKTILKVIRWSKLPTFTVIVITSCLIIILDAQGLVSVYEETCCFVLNNSSIIPEHSSLKISKKTVIWIRILIWIGRILYLKDFLIQIRFLPSTQEGVELNKINARVIKFNLIL